MKDRDYIQSIERCFAILGHLSSPDAFFSLEDLTQKTGLNKTTCFRFLKTMRHLGLVEQNTDKKTYQLGPAIVSLA
jgi:DNA-binding IclR family transcriptional regulator